MVYLYIYIKLMRPRQGLKNILLTGCFEPMIIDEAHCFIYKKYAAIFL